MAIRSMRALLCRRLVARLALLIPIVVMLAGLLLTGFAARSVFEEPRPKLASVMTEQDRSGYWLTSADGGVFAFGAPYYGAAVGARPGSPIVAIAASHEGYWLASADGGVFAFGDAQFYGSLAGGSANAPIVDITPTVSHKGYWMVSADGGVFAFGDAAFLGSANTIALNKPIVAIAATLTGKGYWLFGADGGVFGYGDAAYFGSPNGSDLRQPLVDAAVSTRGKGYILVATDGSVFTYGDAKNAGASPSGNAVGLALSGERNGYWVAQQDGKVHARDVADKQLGVNIVSQAPIVDIAAASFSMKEGESRAFAGTSDHGFNGDGGAARETQFNRVNDVATDYAGNVYVADTENHRVRKIDANGVVTTIAGTGERGFSGDGRSGRWAKLASPAGVAIDVQGNVLIADTGNNRIRRIDNNGDISTVAGTGKRGFSGDGGLASKAKLAYPRDVAIDAQGAILIADTQNCRVRRIDNTSVINTFVGNGKCDVAAAGLSKEKAQLVPNQLSVDRENNLYVADAYQQRVHRVGVDGKVSVLAQGGTPAAKIKVRAGDTPEGVVGVSATRYGVVMANSKTNSVDVVVDGRAPRQMASVDARGGVTETAEGDLMVVDSRNGVLRIVRPAAL